VVTTTIQLQPDRRSIFTRLQLDRTTTIRRPTLRLKAYIQCGLLHWGRNEQAVRELGRQNIPRPCKLTLILTLKVVSESRVAWATSVPILVFLGLSVLAT